LSGCGVAEWACTELHTLSLHDALPLSRPRTCRRIRSPCMAESMNDPAPSPDPDTGAPHAAHENAPGGTDGAGEVEQLARGALERSEEHTSELQSRENVVCRLLPDKKRR